MMKLVITLLLTLIATALCVAPSVVGPPIPAITDALKLGSTKTTPSVIVGTCDTFRNTIH
jgi:hypothetical protein